MQNKFKSRTFRRVKVKTATETVTQYRKPKPSKAKCAGCGKVLAGVPHQRPYKMQNMPKTLKRPERPYGGVLCSSCMRKQIISEVRK